MLKNILVERRQLHDDPGRQVSRIKGEIWPPEPRLTAQRRGDVPYGRQMPHLLDGDLNDLLAPAPDRFRLYLRQSLVRRLQAEGGVQVSTHQVVFEFGRLVERMDQLFPAWRAFRNPVGHLTLVLF